MSGYRYKFRLFRFLCFEEKKYIFAAKSDISTYFYLAVGVIRHLLGRIMNVVLSYLPKCTDFFFIGFIK